MSDELPILLVRINTVDAALIFDWLKEIRLEIQESVEEKVISKNQYRREKRLCDVLMGAIKYAERNIS